MSIIKSLKWITFILLIPVTTLAQSSIPPEYRGTDEAIARGILEGNLFQTNFRNHGEHSRWSDFPFGIYPRDFGSPHLFGFGFLIAARVPGEREKWAGYYGEDATDTMLKSLIINYRDAGLRLSPYTGDIWGWLPLPGFNNPDRLNELLQAESVPASSNDKTSWPEFWPDRMDETDPGWPDSWNGFRGRGLANGDQETFYVMDDFSDLEYSFGIEVEGPHSDQGVYIPVPSDSTIGGLGTQVEVRTFQFEDIVSEDILFTQYRTTNVSEKDLEDVWTGTITHFAPGFDQVEYKHDQNLIYFWDSDGTGGNPSFAGQPSSLLRYTGLLILEYSSLEDNGIDEDEDGIIDESKFNGPGELIEGKAAIDTYLEANYNMELFNQKHIDLEEFPAYKVQRWWTGDEDLDWVGFDDINGNGSKDEAESLIDDVGKDGLGPDANNYPGPDEGEGDGIPTQGEPNFGEQDMLEAELGNLVSFIDVKPRPYYESGDNLRGDWLFDQVVFNQFDNPRFLFLSFSTGDEPFLLMGVGPHSLKKNTSSYFTTALIFGEDEEDLLKNAEVARTIYESDYGQSQLLTSNEPEPSGSIPDQFSLSQNYPNPFNPTTNIEFSLSKSAPVTLTVFDITGRKVQSLFLNKSFNAGTHTVQFDADNLSSGVYIYRLEVAGEVFTKKLTLIK